MEKAAGDRDDYDGHDGSGSGGGGDKIFIED